LTKKNPICVCSATSIEDTLQILSENKFLSAPVFQLSEGNKQYLGFVDCLDIVYYLVANRTQKEESQLLLVPLSTFWRDPQLPPLLRKKQIFVLEPTTPLDQVVQIFITPQEPCSIFYHHILVRQYGDFQLEHRILSQTDVITFLSKKLPNTLLQTRAENMGLANPLGKPNLTVMSEDHFTFEGFQKMYEEHITALPIVNKEGKLITTLSSSDTRGLNRKNLGDIMLTILDYLKKRHGELIHPITCFSSDTLEEIITKILVGKVHRVWVINSQEKVMGVISNTDILRVIGENS